MNIDILDYTLTVFLYLEGTIGLAALLLAILAEVCDRLDGK